MWRSRQLGIVCPLTNGWFVNKMKEGTFRFWGIVIDRFGNVLQDSLYPSLLQQFWFLKFCDRNKNGYSRYFRGSGTGNFTARENLFE